MSVSDILRNVTFRDIVRMDTIFQAKRKFVKRSIIELEYIRLADIISGQTDWDFSHIRYINSVVRYVQYNRILRSAFYSADKWTISGKRSHSIFLSQAGYPIKGLHQVLKAVNLLKDDFPDVTIRVAGDDIAKNNNFKDKIRLSGYGKYILGLIREFGLEDNIRFVGSLNQDSMIKEYLNCHVFVCPSSIENESNSIAEAQILGVPCVSSYVGGVPDMVSHGETGLLYRFEEVEMLAENIRKIFTDDEFAKRLSIGGIEVASKRHDQRVNLEQTLQIYKDIIRN
jgi:glycosyltransferase involved in cell wall biosynthesis